MEIAGKYLLIDEPFSVKGRKHCRVKCLWCGKEFTTQLRHIKKGIGCSCKENSMLQVNQRFGLLRVLSFCGKDVVCECECGSIKKYIKGNLISNNTTNCGCDKSRKLISRSTKHGMSNTKIYKIYLGMKSRCYNPNEYSYKWYGKLGITVCDEWLGENGFINFYNWAMNSGYVSGLSIERKNVDKGYSPDNCTWIDIDKQHENTSNTIRIYNDTGFCFVKDISQKYNIPKSTIYAKIKEIGKDNLTEQKLIKALKRSD
jgi:hypothetical protein